MRHRILTCRIRDQYDVVFVRQRARELARLLEFDQQDQVRIATAVSEIARNSFEHAGGGEADFAILTDEESCLEIVIRDNGKGVQSLKEIFDGTYSSPVGLGIGLAGARRLMDDLRIETTPKGGSVITLRKNVRFSRAIGADEVRKLVDQLVTSSRSEPLQEVQFQNQELLSALSELQSKQEELEKLNQELEDTNRGVVALYAELDEKAEALRKANLAKTRFLSNITHEFRTPLGAMVTLANCLLEGMDGALNPGQTELVETIRKSAEELLELVNDLLDIAKVEAGKIPVKVTEFTAAGLLSSLRSTLKPLADRSPSVKLVFEDVPPIAFETDEGKLGQVLRNFISNAVKYTAEGTVTVRAEAAENDQVRFTVKDTGIGIKPENLETIFEEFVQIESKQQAKHKGTGLGLSLTQKLVRLLGGRIEVKSEFGKGSTFSVIVPTHYTGPRVAQIIGEPIVRPESKYSNFAPGTVPPRSPSSEALPSGAPGPEPASTGAPSTDAPAPESARFLIVDDEADERAFLKQALASLYGGEIREAPDGPTALEILKDFRPDLIFLDLNMPGMDGFEVYRRLRSNPEWSQQDVVIHSSKALNSRERDLLSGSIGHLGKLELSEEQFLSELRRIGARANLELRFPNRN